MLYTNTHFSQGKLVLSSVKTLKVLQGQELHNVAGSALLGLAKIKK